MFLVNSIWSQEQNQQERDNIMKDMTLEDLEIAMKVVIVGNGSVGKSSMIQRFCRGIFTRDYKKTIGVDFLERMLTIDEHSVRLMLWDTAGQEEFDAITRTYYRGANACVLACSVTDKESFLALPKWKSKVSRECGDIPMVLVANKVDLQKQAVVDSSQIDKMARELGVSKLFKTSVKEDLNVTSVFTHLAQLYTQTVISLNAEDEECSLPTTEDDTQQLHSSSHPLFGNNKTKTSKKIANGSQNVANNGNNKGILRSPVILKSEVSPNLQNQRGFFSSAKNKLMLSQNNHNSGKKASNGNGIATYSYTPNAQGRTLRWNDTGKYDNMPFRLDLVKAKKRRRELCNIL